MSVEHLPIAPQVEDDPIIQYVIDLQRQREPVSPIDDVLGEMEDLAEKDEIPIIGSLEGSLIEIFIKMQGNRIKNVLDIGTAIGYSAIWLARSLPNDAHITSLERDTERIKIATEYIERAGIADRVTIIEGDVFDVLPTLDQKYDLILQDIIKHAYFGQGAELPLKLLDLMLDRLADGGVLLGDNAFCLGKVLENGNVPQQVAGIKAYNDAVARHPALTSLIIPIRDGLWISHKNA